MMVLKNRGQSPLPVGLPSHPSCSDRASQGRGNAEMHDFKRVSAARARGLYSHRGAAGRTWRFGCS